MNVLLIPDRRRDEKVTFGPGRVAALPSGRGGDALRFCSSLAEQLTVVVPDLPS